MPRIPSPPLARDTTKTYTAKSNRRWTNAVRSVVEYTRVQRVIVSLMAYVAKIGVKVTIKRICGKERRNKAGGRRQGDTMEWRDVCLKCYITAKGNDCISDYHQRRAIRNDAEETYHAS